MLKLSIIRALFSVSIENILFIKITSSLISIFERIYNFAIAVFDTFLSFLYICIILLEFNFTILDFDFENFNCENFANFDFAILNISINNKLRFFFIMCRYWLNLILITFLSNIFRKIAQFYSINSFTRFVMLKLLRKNYINKRYLLTKKQ